MVHATAPTTTEKTDAPAAPLPPLDIPDTVLSARLPTAVSGETPPPKPVPQWPTTPPRPAAPQPTTAPSPVPSPMPPPQTASPGPALWRRWWVVCAAAAGLVLLVALLFRDGPTRPPGPRKAPESNLQRLARQGQEAFAQRRYRQAIKSWKRAIKLASWRDSPQFPTLYKSLGDAYKARGDDYASLALYRRYLKHLPSTETLARQALQKLMRPLETSLAARTRKAKALLGQLQQQLQRSRWEQAHELFQQFTQSAPSAPAIHRQLLASLSRFPHVALALLKPILNDFVLTKKQRKSFEKMQKKLQIKVGQLRRQRAAALKQSQALAGKGKWKQAREILQKALGSDVQMTQAGTHKALRAISRWAVARGDLRAARALLELYRGLLFKFVKRGLYDWFSGDKRQFPSQREIASQAKTLAALEAAQGSWRRANQALQKGRWQRAGRHFRRAHAQWQQAKQTDGWGWSAALKQSPIRSGIASWPKALQRLSRRVQRARAATRLARLARAIRHHQKILALLPRLPAARRWRRKSKRAIARLRTSQQLLRRAKALMRQKRWRRAEALLVRFRKRHPKAWNRSAIKEQIHLCRCGYGGVTWKLCKKQRFQ